jgi:hypothetical protein
VSDPLQPGCSPARQLYDAVAAVLADWLVRSVVVTAERLLGVCPPEVAAEARAMADRESPPVLARVEHLLGTDVDEQRSNPLAVLRSAVAGPTDVLRRAGVPIPHRDEFARRAFPEDVYGLSPATWADVDESLHEPGIVWGAWKAATVLARRRAEGLS